MYQPIATESSRKKLLTAYPSWLSQVQTYWWMWSGQNDKVIDYWTTVLKQDMSKPQISAVKFMIKAQAFSEAREYLERLIHIDTENIGEIRYLLARCYLGQGQLSNAIEEIELALDVEPEKAQYLDFLADCLLEIGDWQGAVEALNKSLRADPKQSETIFRLGTIYSYHGEHLEALRCFQGCCELQPNRPVYWEMKAETHLQLRQLPQAARSFERSLRFGMNPDVAARLAYCYIQLNKVKKGINYYKMVLKYEPDHYDALCNLAAAYQNIGRSVDALTLLEKAKTIYPNDPILLNNLGYTLVHLGRTRKAIEQYQEALRIAHDHPLILYNLSICYAQKGNWNAAKETLSCLLTVDSNHSDGWILLGNVYDNTEEYDLAVDCYNRALNLH